MVPKEVIDALRRRLEALSTIEPFKSSWSQVVQWHIATRPLILQYFADQLDPFEKPLRLRWSSFPRGMVRRNGQIIIDSEDEERRENDRLTKIAHGDLVAHLTGLIELLELPGSGGVAGSVSATHQVAVGKKIFIVHGHDEGMMQHVARTISTLGLEPIILSEQTNSGSTIIEKFERNAEVGYAVVLFTPDDMAFIKGNRATTARPRARQNVILELGYFAAKLGRGRVFALLKNGDGLEMPSDLSGVVYVPYEGPGNWPLRLVQELSMAGYVVDANALIKKS
ncbi:hypothetical protein BH10PLA2_BH10PLA2_12280 [soil metagenome]